MMLCMVLSMKDSEEKFKKGLQPTDRIFLVEKGLTVDKFLMVKVSDRDMEVKITFSKRDVQYLYNMFGRELEVIESVNFANEVNEPLVGKNCEINPKRQQL